MLSERMNTWREWKMQVPQEFDENILHQLLLVMISFLEGIIK
jgi:hypothetical protein